MVLGPGAGAGMTHPFMAALAGGSAERRIATLLYQFASMERGSKRPDAPALAHLPGVVGLVFVGCPLHPADRPGIVALRMLFLQGRRDRVVASASAGERHAADLPGLEEGTRQASALPYRARSFDHACSASGLL